MFLIEIWLDENNRAAALIESSPPNFNFLDVVRAGRRGGGVAVIFKDIFLCKQISFSTSKSFEYLSVILNSSAKTVLLNIYRPPKYSTTFLMTWLTIIVTDFDCVIITGDFNIHVYNPNDKNALDSVSM